MENVESIDNTNKKGINVNTQDNNVNTQENIVTESSYSEDITVKQSNSKQKAKKKSGSIKKTRSQKKKEQSKYLEMLDLLVENTKKIMSKKSGRKAFKKCRERSYKRFIAILNDYCSNNGIDDLYYYETTSEFRDVYLEWLYGIKGFKIKLNNLSDYNSYYFDYIIDAPYVFYDKITEKTYLYIELHYINRIKAVLIDSEKWGTKSLLYKVIANRNEEECFKREVYLSHKLAMLTYKKSPKYTFYHDSDDEKLINEVEENELSLNRICHFETNYPGFRNTEFVKNSFSIVIDVLGRLELLELLGIIMNYYYAYPQAVNDKYYYAPGKANSFIAVNLLRSILECLKISDCISIIIDQDRKSDNACRKANTMRSSFRNHNFIGVVIKTNTITDQTEIQGISYEEYGQLKSFFSFISEKSDIESMCYNDSEKELYDYLAFKVRYSRALSNENAFASFNGLFYLFCYFYKRRTVKFDVFFKILKDMLSIDIDVDEIIELELLSENEIMTEKVKDAEVLRVGVHGDAIAAYEFDSSDITTEQQTDSAPKQYDKEDIERVYRSMCFNEFKKYVIYDKQNEDDKREIIGGIGPFLKYFKKQRRYALCFLEDKKPKNDTKPKESFIDTFLAKAFQQIDGITADKKAVDMLYKCIIEHNRKIIKKTIGASDNLIQYNIYGNHKFYAIVFDVEDLDA